jgi:hypothetical protein
LDVPHLRTLVAAESVVLALFLVVSGCGGEKLSKEQYESRVCNIMIDELEAESRSDPKQAMGEAADELSSISAPLDVEGLHDTLVSEFKKASETPSGDVDLLTQHLAAATRALSEIRAKGYTSSRAGVLVELDQSFGAT